MKQINIYDGKYTINMNENGTIHSIQRHREDWPASESYKHSGFVLALVQELIDKDDLLEFYEVVVT